MLGLLTGHWAKGRHGVVVGGRHRAPRGRQGVVRAGAYLVMGVRAFGVAFFGKEVAQVPLQVQEGIHVTGMRERL